MRIRLDIVHWNVFCLSFLYGLRHNAAMHRRQKTCEKRTTVFYLRVKVHLKVVTSKTIWLNLPLRICKALPELLLAL